MNHPLLDAMRPQPTGGLIVSFKEGADSGKLRSVLENSAGAGVRSGSAADASVADVEADASAIMFDELGIAVVPGREELRSVAATLEAEDAVQEVRPEFWMFALQPYADTAHHTWGVAATGAETSPYLGRGIKICVLDTGLDLQHPDFAGRAVASQSFVAGETVQDVQGHGTHCAGTAAGRAQTADMPRYGVAPDAELFVGKVLNDAGSGRERDILAGMLWAVRNGCAVISMSLGRAVQPGEPPSLAYERVGRLALQQRSLIIAAAGNDSSRRCGVIAPVGAPANAPSIMAVAALDQALDVAEFSSGGINPDGGEVDIAGPGVGVFSSVPRPMLYRSLRGTSMACPHVAGVAALWAESDPTLRGHALWDRLLATARDIGQPQRDVGRGLVQAPSATIG